MRLKSIDSFGIVKHHGATIAYSLLDSKFKMG
jgi:hypothetical protein